MGITKDYIKENIVLIVSFSILLLLWYFISPVKPNPHLMNYTDCINYRFNEFNFTFPSSIKGMFVYEKGDYNMTIIQTINPDLISAINTDILFVYPIFMYNLNASSRCLLIGRVENMTDFIRLYNLEYHEIEVKRNKIVGVK